MEVNLSPQHGRYPGPGLSNPLAGRVAAILNNLFKQVRAHRLRILRSQASPGCYQRN